MGEPEQDPFDRAVAREAQLRQQLDDGRLEPDRVAALAELQGAEPQLSPAVLRLIADEGLEPDEVLAALHLQLGLSPDELVRLLAEGASLEFFLALQDVGLPVTQRLAGRLVEEDLDLSGLVRLRHEGFDFSFEDALAVAEEGADLDDLRAELAAFPDPKPQPGQVVRWLRAGTELADVAAIVGLGLGLSLDDAAQLAERGADPAALGRLRQLPDLDLAELRKAVRPGATVMVGFSGGGGGGTGQHFVGAGRASVNKDGVVRGLFVGTMRVRPGVRAVIETFVVGDVEVQLGAEVTIAGTVTGDVLVAGGSVQVTGRVRGAVIDVAARV